MAIVKLQTSTGTIVNLNESVNLDGIEMKVTNIYPCIGFTNTFRINGLKGNKEYSILVSNPAYVINDMGDAEKNAKDDFKFQMLKITVALLFCASVSFLIKNIFG